MEKVWLQSYQPGVPETINPNAYASINELFLETCGKYSYRNAFVNMGAYLTFSDLEQQSRNFAAFLQNTLKLNKGDRVAIMLPNVLQYPVVMFGALRAGMIVVNVNPLYTAKELLFQLADSGANTIIVLENFAHTVAEVLTQTAVRHVIVTKLGDMLGGVKGALVNFVVKHIKRMVPDYSSLPNVISLKSALESSTGLALNPVTVSSSDIAFLQYTGGTTGVAKGAMLTHSNLVANMEQATAWIKNSVSMGSEIIITALPLYHIFSLTANCLVFMRLGALNVLITNPKDINGFVKELKKHQFTTITGVNTLFNALLNNPNFHKLDFSSLKMVLGGGMAVQHAVADRWKHVTGKVLLEAYGLTETSPAVCMNPLSLRDYNGSIGLPISSTEVSIRDDNNQELGFDTPGELCVRGPQVMAGYWHNDVETAKVLSKDGWFKTGDIATISKTGFVKIVDRKKDMILVSGFNVYPNEVEDVIAEIAAVKEVAVIGLPNGASGESVNAYIVRKENDKLTVDEILKHCHKNLTGYKVPKHVIFCEELPKTNVGKVLRRSLRDEQLRLRAVAAAR
jgi:long-chain acyl-CoA synthetase